MQKQEPVDSSLVMRLHGNGNAFDVRWQQNAKSFLLSKVGESQSSSVELFHAGKPLFLIHALDVCIRPTRTSDDFKPFASPPVEYNQRTVWKDPCSPPKEVVSLGNVAGAGSVDWNQSLPEGVRFDRFYVWARLPNPLLDMQGDDKDWFADSAWLIIGVERKWGKINLSHLGVGAGPRRLLCSQLWWMRESKEELNSTTFLNLSAEQLEVKSEDRYSSHLEREFGLKLEPVARNSGVKLLARVVEMEDRFGLQFERTFGCAPGSLEAFFRGQLQQTIQFKLSFSETSRGREIGTPIWRLRAKMGADSFLVAGWNVAVDVDSLAGSKNPTAHVRWTHADCVDPGIDWVGRVSADAQDSVKTLALTFESFELNGTANQNKRVAVFELPLARSASGTPATFRCSVSIQPTSASEKSLELELKQIRPAARGGDWYAIGDLDVQFSSIFDGNGRIRVRFDPAGKGSNFLAGSTRARTWSVVLSLPVAQIRQLSVPRFEDSKVSLAETAPLLIPLDSKAPSEDGSNTHFEKNITLELDESDGLSATKELFDLSSLDGPPAPPVRRFHAVIKSDADPFAGTETIYIDSQPLMIALIKVHHSRESQDGRKSYAETTPETAAGPLKWTLQATKENFTVVLPPQGVAETMEKIRNSNGGAASFSDLSPSGYADFRLTPAAELTLQGSDSPSNFGVLAWNLRNVFGRTGSERFAGIALLGAKVELLYGVGIELTDPPNLRVAEMFARLGDLRSQLIEPRDHDFRSDKALLLWKHSLVHWDHYRALVLRRLGVLELFDDRISFSRQRRTDFAQAELFLDSDAYAGDRQGDLTAELRIEAKEELATSFTTDNGDRLGGSFAWAFESPSLYKDLWKEGSLKANRVSLRRLYLSALGAWGQSDTEFRNGAAVFSVRLEMGRIAELRVEHHGRISVFWNRAKLVTVFRRQVLGSDQFSHTQDEQTGRAALRKVEEYLEFTQQVREYPDRIASSDANGDALPRVIQACIAGGRIPVDSRLGQDLHHQGVALGWIVPLCIPPDSIGTAAEAVYRSPRNLRLRLAALDGTAAGGSVEAQLFDTEKLYFWTQADNSNQLNKNKRVDYERWNVLAGIDGPTASEMVGDQAVDKVDLGEVACVPAYPAAYQRFTFRIELPPGSKVDLSPGGKGHPSMESRLSTVTVYRKPEVSASNPIPAQKPRVIADFSAGALSQLDLLGDLRSGTESINSEKLVNALRVKVRKDFQAMLKGVGGHQFAQLDAKAIARGIAHSARQAIERVFTETVEYLSLQINDAKVTLGNAEFPSCEEAKKALSELVGRLELRQQGVRIFFDLRGMDAAVIGFDPTKLEDLKCSIDQYSKAGERQALLARSVLQYWRDALREWPVRRWPHGFPAEVFKVLSDCEAGLDDILANPAANTSQLLAKIDKANEFLQGLDWKNVNQEIEHGIHKDFKLIIEKVQTLIIDQVVQVRSKVESECNNFPELIRTLGDGIESSELQLSELIESIRVRRDEYLAGFVDLRGSLVTSVIDRLHGIKNRATADLQRALSEKFCNLEAILVEFNAAGRNVKDILKQGRELVADIQAAIPIGISSSIEGWNEGIVLATVSVVEIELPRSFGKVPEVPLMAFTGMVSDQKNLLEKGLRSRIQSIGYRLHKAANQLEARCAVSFSQIRMGVDRVQEELEADMGQASRELKLKGLAIQQSVSEFKRAAEDIEGRFRGKLSDLEQDLRDGLGKVLPDFAGISLETLLRNALGPDVAASLDRNLVVNHSFDRENKAACVSAELKEVTLGDTDIFTFGPVSLRLIDPRLRAKMKIETSVLGEVSRSEFSSIKADWQLVCSSKALVTLKRASLVKDGARVNFEFDPKQVEMDGSLQAVADTLKDLSGDVDNAIDAVGSALQTGEIRAGYELRLPPITVGQGSPVIVGLSFGLAFWISVRRDRFAIEFGLSLARRTSPFAITFSFLGGCGYFEILVRYEVPLPLGQPPRLVVEIAVGLGAAAGTGFNLGPIRGFVLATLSFEFFYRRTPEGSEESRFSLCFTFVGSATVWGFVTVSIAIHLSLRYSRDGGLVGEGSIRVSVRISFFVRLSFGTGFKRQLSKGRASAGATASDRVAPRALASGYEGFPLSDLDRPSRRVQPGGFYT